MVLSLLVFINPLEYCQMAVAVRIELVIITVWRGYLLVFSMFFSSSNWTLRSGRSHFCDNNCFSIDLLRSNRRQ